MTVTVLTLITTCECTFSLYYGILIQGDKTYMGTNNFIDCYTAFPLQCVRSLASSWLHDMTSNNGTVSRQKP